MNRDIKGKCSEGIKEIEEVIADVKTASKLVCEKEQTLQCSMNLKTRYVRLEEESIIMHSIHFYR